MPCCPARRQTTRGFPARRRRGDRASGGGARPSIPEDRREVENGAGCRAGDACPRDVARRVASSTSELVPPIPLPLHGGRAIVVTAVSHVVHSARERTCRRRSRSSVAWVCFCSV